MADKQKKTIEEVMAEYAKKEEQEHAASSNMSPASRVGNSQPQAQSLEPPVEKMSLAEAQQNRREEILNETRELGLGWIQIPTEDLPSGGIFYPNGTKISIRAASGADIRHWSMMDDKDVSEIDDALNYIIERCCIISFPSEYGIGQWKDLKDIDRLYIILAIRDFTFPEGHNELKINLNENDTVIVKKDNISFIDLPDWLLKYYNEEKRCFTFKSDNPQRNQLNFYIPSIGTIQWFKTYISKKQAMQEPFDRDFVRIAQILISDYKKLSDKTYSDLVSQSMNYTIRDWSLISKVKSALEQAITPKMTYNDSSGAEQETPLNFRGGLKAIFTLDLDEELGI